MIKHFVIVVVSAVMLSGCVVLSRRDYNYVKMAEHSLGYMQGMSEASRIWEYDLLRCEEDEAMRKTDQKLWRQEQRIIGN